MRRQTGMTLGLWLLAGLLALPLLLWQGQAQPLTLETRNGAATIRFSATPDRVLFPAQCIGVAWQAEGIQAIYVNGRGSVGAGTAEVCPVDNIPFLNIVLQSGEEARYELPVQRLYQQPLVIVVWGVLLLMLGLALYRTVGAPGVIVLAVVVIFAPMLRSQMNLVNDYIDHNMFAAIAIADPSKLPPHFLYHILIIGLTQLFPGMNLDNAGFWVMLVAYCLTGLLTYALLRRLSDGKGRPLLLGGLALGMMLIGPLGTLESSVAAIYPNIYHNPTIGLMKPLALATLLALLPFLTNEARLAGWRVGVLALLTVLVTLAKPNFTMALAPAAALLLPVAWWLDRRIQWLALLLGVLLPAGAVLLWQYLFLFNASSTSAALGGGGAQLVFAPFEFYTVSGVDPLALVVNLLLSLGLPLVVYGLYFAAARREIGLNVAWLLFLIAQTQAYLFNERPQIGSGNLTWGGQIALYILMLVSLGYGLKWEQRDWRTALWALVFAAHLVTQVLRLV